MICDLVVCCKKSFLYDSHENGMSVKKSYDTISIFKRELATLLTAHYEIESVLQL